MSSEIMVFPSWRWKNSRSCCSSSGNLTRRRRVADVFELQNLDPINHVRVLDIGSALDL
ncbi:hypothetical protein F442_22215 [Phytophthora nicotianae P10297]|uniref:Uncharacterized protein n=1 Tax=Phytophthora nicotianae P10297 TaxID=1317064 RepID=W2Y0I9_PHYNI|nr:hypothetical protein F442_22215 [Phytophthora nicotianae P10297]